MLESIIYFIIVGVVAGFLAGKIMKGKGYGFIGNLVIGIIGAVIGGFVFGLVGLSSYGLIGAIISALVGAIILIWIIGKLKK